MREIKFRLWCKNKNEWEKDHWHLSPNGHIVDNLLNKPMKKETHILMQYTGLKDKNGKEIYEGDILEKDNKHLAEIVFHDGCFRGKFIIETKLFYFVTDRFDMGQHIEWFEVIGNIYENKELLSERKDNK